MILKFERAGYTFEVVPGYGWRVNGMLIPNTFPPRSKWFDPQSRSQIKDPKLMVIANSVCGLRCLYCYDRIRTDHTKTLTPEHFDVRLVHVSQYYHPDAVFGAIVYGGEPLLNPQLIYHLINHPRFNRVHVVSGLNAPLILNPKVDYCFSIDPPSEHYPRVTPDGSSFYRESLDRIKPYADLGKDLYIRSTLTRNAWNYRKLYEDIHSLYPNNFISVKPEAVFDDGPLALDIVAIEGLRKLFRQDFEEFRRLKNFSDHFNAYAADFVRGLVVRDFPFGGCGSFHNRMVISVEVRDTFCNEISVNGEGGEFVSWSTEDGRDRIIQGVVSLPPICSCCDVRDYCGSLCPMKLFLNNTSACSYRKMVVEEGLLAFFQYSPIATIFKWMAYNNAKNEEDKNLVLKTLLSIGVSHG